MQPIIGDGDGTMRTLCYHGKNDIRCDTVPDPSIEHSRDAIVKVTSCAICGSDLHLYDGFMLGAKVEAVEADLSTREGVENLYSQAKWGDRPIEIFAPARTGQWLSRSGHRRSATRGRHQRQRHDPPARPVSPTARSIDEGWNKSITKALGLLEHDQHRHVLKQHGLPAKRNYRLRESENPIRNAYERRRLVRVSCRVKCLCRF